MIRLYGHMAGSFRSVSLGMDRALRVHGKSAGFVKGANISFDEDYPGGDAPVAISTGAAGRVLKPHVKGKHGSHWLMLAPNSNGIDPKLVEQLKGETYSAHENQRRPVLDGLFSPSTWGVQILRSIFPTHPVILWQHGVLPCFRVFPNTREQVHQDYEKGEFRLLHVSSTISPRKGTKEMLLAWKVFKYQHPNLKGRLDLLVNPVHLMDFSDLVKELRVPNVMVIPGQNYSEKRYVDGLSRYHAVIQPSRAEGFGLVPLEARACGVPVIMTTCTGHHDHYNGNGVVEVVSSGEVPSDDYPGATTPDISVVGIAEAIEFMYESWESINFACGTAAQAVQSMWSWESRAKAPLEELDKLLESKNE